MSVKEILGKIVKRIVPYKVYKLIANGIIIVPAYYKTIIEETERNFDLSLEDSDEKAILLMRKYAHILDKGLHREDATPGHSKVCYLTLKSLLDKLRLTAYSKDPSYHWAEEKIAKYEELQDNPTAFTPYRGAVSKSTVGFDELFELMRQRRSNRCFTKANVTNEEINKLKEVANWAASSCNKQPIRLFVTNNQDIARKCLECCAGGTGFGANIPSFWVFTANIRGYVYPDEIFLPSIDTSLGAQNVFLAAQTMGLTGTILTWGQHTKTDDSTLRMLLDIPNDYSIIFCAVIGHAEFSYATPVRKEIIK